MLLSETPPNIIGGLVVDLRDDAGVSALVGRRVRSPDPEPPAMAQDGVTVLEAGDARGPGEYIAFIVLTTLDAPVDPDVPVVFAEVGVRCYGTTPQNAWAVYWALVRALHRAGPRLRANGLGIFQTLVTGGDYLPDPDTKQPCINASIRVPAAAQAVAS